MTQAAPAPSESPCPPDEREAVLLVDDEPALLDAMRQGLGGDFELATASSAAIAEARMAERRYSVVVCDHVMPGEAGLSFLVRMQDKHPATRRILLTGYINPELLSRSFRVAGLSACLLKPLNMEELSRAVRTALIA